MLDKFTRDANPSVIVPSPNESSFMYPFGLLQWLDCVTFFTYVVSLSA